MKGVPLFFWKKEEGKKFLTAKTKEETTMKCEMLKRNAKKLACFGFGMGIGLFVFLCFTSVLTWALDYTGPGAFTISSPVFDSVAIKNEAVVTMLAGGSVIPPTPEPLPDYGTAAIHVNDRPSTTGATFIMEDGVVIGSGGTIFGGDGVFADGQATVEIKGGSIRGSSGPGQDRGGKGIFCWSGGGTLNISGGSINGGDTEGEFAGDGIDMQDCTLNISNATIKGGDSLLDGFAGDGIFVRGSTIKITSGTVEGGSEGGAGIFIQYGNTNMEILGGEIRGGDCTGGISEVSTGGMALAINEGTLTISGGSFKGGNNCRNGGTALHLGSLVSTSIKGGEFHPGTGDEQDGSALATYGLTRIEGGSFFGRVNIFLNGNLIIDGGHFMDAVNAYGGSRCEINGGLFEGNGGQPGTLRGEGNATFYVNGNLNFDGTVLYGTLSDGTAINAVVQLFGNAALFINGVDRTPKPDIELDPYSLNFGNVAWQGSSTLMFTVTNAGIRDLIVSGVSLQVSDGIFSVLGPTSFTLTPGASENVEVSFTASDFGVFNNSVEILSNDPDEWIMMVNLTGTGVVASTPSEQVSDIVQYIDLSITEGSLSASGPGDSANNRVDALINMITAAGDLVAEGKIVEACQQLDAIYRKCDGRPNPPDLITGEDAETIAWMINQLKAQAGCI